MSERLDELVRHIDTVLAEGTEIDEKEKAAEWVSKWKPEFRRVEERGDYDESKSVLKSGMKDLVQLTATTAINKCLFKFFRALREAANQKLAENPDATIDELDLDAIAAD